MEKRSLNLSDELYQYMLDHSLQEPEDCKRLRAHSNQLLMAAMQSPPEESQFIAFLVKLIGAKRILEIGTFTGYTTLWVAQTLPEEGRIITCDIKDRWVKMGIPYWVQAGVAHKIDLRLGPALDTMATLKQKGCLNLFDLVFIDADKENYLNYYEYALELVRPGGIVAVDNVFWGGSVINEKNQGTEVQNIRTLNKRILRDERVVMSMVPIGDGLTLAIRKY